MGVGFGCNGLDFHLVVWGGRYVGERVSLLYTEGFVVVQPSVEKERAAVAAAFPEEKFLSPPTVSQSFLPSGAVTCGD